MYMWSLIKKDMRTYFKKKKNRTKLTDFKTSLMVTLGKTIAGREELKGRNYILTFP